MPLGRAPPYLSRTPMPSARQADEPISESPAEGYVYIAFIDNLSVTFSLYYLVLFYMAAKMATPR